MKKVFILLTVMMVSLSATYAQSSAKDVKKDLKRDMKNVTKFEAGKNAIGLRFGAAQTEISYLKMFSGPTRIEADLGLVYSGGFELNLAYQYARDLKIFDLDNLKWYLGAGPSLGYLSKKLLFGVFAQVGVEYSFDFPISISLDYRPRFRLTPQTGFDADGIALSVRYRF